MSFLNEKGVWWWLLPVAYMLGKSSGESSPAYEGESYTGPTSRIFNLEPGEVTTFNYDIGDIWVWKVKVDSSGPVDVLILDSKEGGYPAYEKSGFEGFHPEVVKTERSFSYRVETEKVWMVFRNSGKERIAVHFDMP